MQIANVDCSQLFYERNVAFIFPFTITPESTKALNGRTANLTSHISDRFYQLRAKRPLSHPY